MSEQEKVLVVAGAAVDEAQLGRELDLEEGSELKVVVPIDPGSGLDLVAGDVDDSIAEAEQRAADAAADVEGTSEATVVGSESGEADPLLAIEDALATFPADRIVIFSHPEGDRDYREDESFENRWSIPVTHAEIPR